MSGSSVTVTLFVTNTNGERHRALYLMFSGSDSGSCIAANENSLVIQVGGEYTLLYQLGHKGALFALQSERKSTKNTHPCFEADI